MLDHAIRILPTLVILLAASCGTGRSGRLPAPDARTPNRVVESTDGRWRLHLRRITLAAPAMPGAPARLSLDARLELGDEDHLLADRDPLVGLQREAGVAYRPASPHAFDIQSSRGEIRLRNLDVGDPPEALARLDLVCRVIETRSWKPHVFRELGPIRRDGLVADPFVLTVTGERHNVWVSAARLDRPEHVGGEDDLSLLLSHRWAAESVKLHDAAGRRLHGWGGSGTNGGTVIGYGAPVAETPFEIAYPVALELLVPHRYEVVTIRFRIEDLPLPPADG